MRDKLGSRLAPSGILFVILVISISARLGIVATTDLSILYTDAKAYDYAARTLVSTGTMLQESFPFAFEINELVADDTPSEEPLHHFSLGFPLYIAGMYKLLGSKVLSRYVAQGFLAILGGLIVPLLGLAIFHCLGGKSKFLGLALTLGIGIWPEALITTGYFLSENLATVILTAWVLSIARLLKSPRPPSVKTLLISGGLGGLLFLVRGEFVPVIIFAAGIIGLKDSWREAAGRILFPLKWEPKITAIFLLAFLPFLMLPTIRNYIHFGEIIPITSAGGKTLWLATMHTDAFLFGLPERRSVAIRNYVPGKPGKTDKNFSRTALDNIRKRPVYFLQGMANRFYLVNFTAFGEPAVRGKSPIFWVWRGILRFNKIILMGAFFLGLFVSKRIFPLLTLFILVIYVYKFLFLHVVFNGYARFFIPFFPIAFAVAMIGIERIWISRQEGTPGSL